MVHCRDFTRAGLTPAIHGVVWMECDPNWGRRDEPMDKALRVKDQLHWRTVDEDPEDWAA
jgi:hypothetical protein